MMSPRKIVFVDRDGTLIEEPPDRQIDSLEKFMLVSDVVPAMVKLREHGFSFVMVTNQDGLGTAQYPRAAYELVQDHLIRLFASQGIEFEDVLVCPHLEVEACACRKPAVGIVQKYLVGGEVDLVRSCVVGDRETDVTFATNMGLRAFHLGAEVGWEDIARELVCGARFARVVRRTRETRVDITVHLDRPTTFACKSGIGFFDHMLEQLARHAGFGLEAIVEGDLHVDEHHTVEDTALALGEALRKALGDKIGIGRYGFVLPMDEAEAKVSIDLSGRPFFVFTGAFGRERVGELPTELVPHFFRSLAETLGAALHIAVEGDNAHHMIESMFKGVGRALRPALTRGGETSIPSTKGHL